MLTHIISAVVLIAQLLKTTKMDRAERIAASRIVYSLAINIVILVGIFYFQLLIFESDQSSHLSSPFGWRELRNILRNQRRKSPI